MEDTEGDMEEDTATGELSLDHLRRVITIVLVTIIPYTPIEYSCKFAMLTLLPVFHIIIATLLHFHTHSYGLGYSNMNNYPETREWRARRRYSRDYYPNVSGSGY